MAGNGGRDEVTISGAVFVRVRTSDMPAMGGGGSAPEL